MPAYPSRIIMNMAHRIGILTALRRQLQRSNTGLLSCINFFGIHKYLPESKPLDKAAKSASLNLFLSYKIEIKR